MIKLHQASQKDYNYLYKLKKNTLKEYIAKTWGWDEKWQKEYFSQNFKPELLKIITLSGKDMGASQFLKKKIITSYQLSKYYQNTKIKELEQDFFKDLLSKAKKLNKSVYLQVLKTNEKAQKLYKRLGFIVEEETEMYLKMIYKYFRG